MKQENNRSFKGKIKMTTIENEIHHQKTFNNKNLKK